MARSLRADAQANHDRLLDVAAAAFAHLRHGHLPEGHCGFGGRRHWHPLSALPRPGTH